MVFHQGFAARVNYLFPSFIRWVSGGSVSSGYLWMHKRPWALTLILLKFDKSQRGRVSKRFEQSATILFSFPIQDTIQDRTSYIHPSLLPLRSLDCPFSGLMCLTRLRQQLQADVETWSAAPSAFGHTRWVGGAFRRRDAQVSFLGLQRESQTSCSALWLRRGYIYIYCLMNS